MDGGRDCKEWMRRRSDGSDASAFCAAIVARNTGYEAFLSAREKTPGTSNRWRERFTIAAVTFKKRTLSFLDSDFRLLEKATTSTGTQMRTQRIPPNAAMRPGYY